MTTPDEPRRSDVSPGMDDDRIDTAVDSFERGWAAAMVEAGKNPRQWRAEGFRDGVALERARAGRGSLDMAPYHAGAGTQMVTHTLSGRQEWRQIGWLGHASGLVFSLDETPDDRGGFSPLWLLVEAEPPAGDEDPA